MKHSELTYFQPREDCEESKAPAAGRRVAALLNVLEDLDQRIAWGQLVDESRAIKQQIYAKLRTEGWRVSINLRNGRWQVLPPEDYYR